ncbi:Coronin-7 [Kappamyces sp. JEL0680]|nr:Coronin-7 [Kappamyces sp. JEL0680]
MAFRNPSKYRNTVLAPEKKQDVIECNRDAPYTQTPDPTPVACCMQALAFRAGNGSFVGLINPSTRGKGVEPISIACGALVTSLEFQHFSKSSVHLSVGTEASCLVFKINCDAPESLSLSCVELVTQKRFQQRVEFALFHPTAANLLAVGSGTLVDIWDFAADSVVFSLDNECRVQDASWSFDGQRLISSGVDNNLRLFDPRNSPQARSVFKSHDGVKASKVVFVTDDLVFTTGFNAKRNREYALWSIAVPSKPLVLTSLDNAQGILTPLVDYDTKMIYLSGKGETKLGFVEVRPELKDPLETGGLPVNIPVQAVGVCLAPKLAMNVMEAIVPRRSYLDFHADIFPETRSNAAPALSSAEWCSGLNRSLPTESLNPAARPAKAAATPTPNNVPAAPVAQSQVAAATTQKESPPSGVAPKPAQGDVSAGNAPDTASPGAASESLTAALGPKTTLQLPKHSLYRHVLTTSSVVFEDYSQRNATITNETNGFDVNEEYMAFIQGGTGGRVGVHPLSKKGRLPSKINSFISGAEVNDMCFDPFDSHQLAVGCDDGNIRIFVVPQLGLDADVLSPQTTIAAHSNRISLIAYHPTIKKLLLSSSPERGAALIKLWNLKSSECVLSVSVGDMVLSAAFNLLGTKFAALSKDQMLTIWDSKTGQVLQQGPSHKGTKAARLVWLHERDALCSVGFGSGSQREILTYNELDLSVPPLQCLLDTSPSILIPYFDMDTGVLMLVGRGESVVLYYEIHLDRTVTYLNRHLFGGTVTTSFYPLAKQHVDVAAVEIVAGYRASQNTVEKVSVTVPRIKKEFFQDDVFPLTVDFQSSSISVSEWLDGAKVRLQYHSLQPPDMKKRTIPILTVVSDVPVEATPVRTVPTFVEVQSEEERKQASMKRMMELAMEQSSGPLVQDLQEGVSDSEWD